ncbi:MAG: hypothetical protein U9Q16_03040 [Patescibacteria group bacterium]|nr:hypothetical protein [Patescibacteria group bacterium]
MNAENLMISGYVKEMIEEMGEEMYYVYQDIKIDNPDLKTQDWKLRFWINFNKKGILIINFLLETDTDKDFLLAFEAPVGHWAFIN